MTVSMLRMSGRVELGICRRRHDDVFVVVDCKGVWYRLVRVESQASSAFVSSSSLSSRIEFDLGRNCGDGGILYSRSFSRLA